MSTCQFCFFCYNDLYNTNGIRELSAGDDSIPTIAEVTGAIIKKGDSGKAQPDKRIRFSVRAIGHGAPKKIARF